MIVLMQLLIYRVIFCQTVLEKDYLVEESYLQKNSFFNKIKNFFIYKTRGLSTLTKYFKTYPDLLDKESYNLL